jgi:DNA mismatch repair protein MSH5
MDTIQALQVFESESHPNFHNQGPSKTRGTKEGFSVYGLFHKFARTPQGKELLRRRFSRPSKDWDQIQESLDTVSALLLPNNSGNLDVLVENLKHIKNIRLLLKKLRKGVKEEQRGSNGPVPTWSTLLSFCHFSRKLIETMIEMDGMNDISIWNKMVLFDRSVLMRVGTSVSDFVDTDESRILLRPAIKQNIDPGLDELKRRHEGLNSLLTEVAKSIKAKFLTENQDLADALEIQYYPGIGHVVEIPETIAHENQGVFEATEIPWIHSYTAESEHYLAPESLN